MDVRDSLTQYHASLQHLQSQFDSLCKDIKLASRRLQNSIDISKQILKQAEEEENQNVLADLRLDEIDDLIRKAEMVFIEEKEKTRNSVVETKMSAVSKQTRADSNVGDEVVKRSSLKQRVGGPVCSSLNEQGANPKKAVRSKSKGKSKLRVKNEIKTMQPPLLQKDNETSKKKQLQNESMAERLSYGGSEKCEKRREELPLLFDSAFKETYCTNHRLGKRLKHLKMNENLMQMNRQSMNEFLSAMDVPSRGDGSRFEYLMDTDKLAQMSSLSAPEMSDILENVYDIRRNGQRLLNSNRGCSVGDVEQFVMLTKLRNDVLFQRELMHLMKSFLLQEGVSGTELVSRYRQLYSLLGNTNQFPILVHNE